MELGSTPSFLLVDCQATTTTYPATTQDQLAAAADPGTMLYIFFGKWDLSVA